MRWRRCGVSGPQEGGARSRRRRGLSSHPTLVVQAQSPVVPSSIPRFSTAPRPQVEVRVCAPSAKKQSACEGQSRRSQCECRERPRACSVSRRCRIQGVVQGARAHRLLRVAPSYSGHRARPRGHPRELKIPPPRVQGGKQDGASARSLRPLRIALHDARSARPGDPVRRRASSRSRMSSAESKPASCLRGRSPPAPHSASGLFLPICRRAKVSSAVMKRGVSAGV
ncbi:hypothetical protein DFH09DRAFT_1143497 [Mycena vulgaris]|nr:hypothetical protein DFH09DRAFT_1143497 [Mycena vulgaris]